MDLQNSLLGKPIEIKLSNALKNRKVIDFVTNIFIESYKSHFYPYTKEVELMVLTAMSLLKAELTEKEFHRQSLSSIVNYINENIFKTNNNSFWFNKIYSHYKKITRPKLEYAQIKGYIKGKKILDFGSGIGSLALEFKKRKLIPHTADVIDYRIKEAQNLPFLQMKTPTSLELADNSIDTITVKSVLHHIDRQYLIAVIDELKRVAKRLIIEESVFYEVKDENVKSVAKGQKAFTKFLEFTAEEQMYALLLIDFFTNALAFGKPIMNLPFEFKTLEKWTSLLTQKGFSVLTTIPLGFEEERITPDSRAIIVADKIE